MIFPGTGDVLIGTDIDAHFDLVSSRVPEVSLKIGHMTAEKEVLPDGPVVLADIPCHTSGWCRPGTGRYSGGGGRCSARRCLWVCGCIRPQS